jgi:arsenate reductase
MSRALFDRDAAGRHESRSAGTTPADRVHPEVVEVIDELGIGELADPHGRSLEDVRRIRDEIASRVDGLERELDAAG